MTTEPTHMERLRDMQAPRPKRGPKVLAPVRPNVGLQIAYRKRLDALIAEMHAEVMATITPLYADDPSTIAQDAAPTAILQRAIRELAVRWQRRLDASTYELAAYFATHASERADGALAAILKRAGLTVPFRLTPEIRNIIEATVAENVTLIRSVASQYLSQVEGDVMRAVSVGRDLGPLAKKLQYTYGVTKRRAALISRDQNNKATAVIVKARQEELGLKAIWQHSTGGKTPRPSHVKQSGKEYDPKTGWFDPDAREWVWPGTLINCRCTSRSVIRGLT